MASPAVIVKDEWTPTLQKLVKKLSNHERKRFYGDLGEKIVFVIKNNMDRSIGFGDKRPYKKLKIKWRYRGGKNLIASTRNIRRAPRGSQIRMETIGGVRRETIRVADKQKVTSSTKPLIFTTALLRSWNVRRFGPGFVEIGPHTAAESEKAIYNDDRGDWNWRRRNSKEALDRFLEYIDDEIWT